MRADKSNDVGLLRREVDKLKQDKARLEARVGRCVCARIMNAERKLLAQKKVDELEGELRTLRARPTSAAAAQQSGAS